VEIRKKIIAENSNTRKELDDETKIQLKDR
jgi:hypothetical protein